MPNVQQDEATVAELTSVHAPAPCPPSADTAPASSARKKPFRLGRKHRGLLTKQQQQQQLQLSRPASMPTQVSRTSTLYLLLSPICSCASLRSFSVSDAVRTQGCDPGQAAASEPTKPQQLLLAELAAAQEKVAALQRDKAEGIRQVEDCKKAVDDLRQALHAEQQRSAEQQAEVSTAHFIVTALDTLTSRRTPTRKLPGWRNRKVVIL